MTQKISADFSCLQTPSDFPLLILKPVLISFELVLPSLKPLEKIPDKRINLSHELIYCTARSCF